MSITIPTGHTGERTKRYKLRSSICKQSPEYRQSKPPGRARLFSVSIFGGLILQKKKKQTNRDQHSTTSGKKHVLLPAKLLLLITLVFSLYRVVMMVLALAVQIAQR